ncbi:hypothetical protein [Bacteroides fragilis]|uniref:hypothetical protein n=1 Tax=Bacteroides fragilis TaxID=817 RepID=UPI0022AAEF2A|nr:hypothetical protein [Bacteroides fragilis]MCZ2563930.1 hypothetical protein [Bacteroides fragilis]
MNKNFFIAMLAFALLGMTNVMANTSKDEVVEVSSTNKVTATEYYLEAAGQSGSGLFYSIELLDSSQRKLKITAKRGLRIEINCHGHGIVPDDRLFYTSDSWTGEVITDEINTEAFTISTSYNESSSSSTIKYETRYYYIREK